MKFVDLMKSRSQLDSVNDASQQIIVLCVSYLTCDDRKPHIDNNTLQPCISAIPRFSTWSTYARHNSGIHMAFTPTPPRHMRNPFHHVRMTRHQGHLTHPPARKSMRRYANLRIHVLSTRYV